METKDLLVPIASFVGVIVGGAITSAAKWVELRHARRVELADRRIDRVEEISRLLITFGRDAEGLPNSAVRIANFGKHGGKQNYIQQVNELKARISGQASTTATLLSLYTDIPPGQIVEASSAAAEAAYDYVMLPETPQTATGRYSSLIETAEKLHEEIVKLSQLVSAELRRLVMHEN